MEQRIAELFASVGNALDSSTYTYSDSDYLVRKALVKFLDGENALVASVRQTPDNAGVVDSILNYIISTEFSAEDPATWYRRAMGIVVEFADLAHRNEGSEEASRFAALLPEGHPRAARVLSLTASAHRDVFAEWIAADPRLSEEASVVVYDVYSSDPQNAEDLDFRFNYLKMGALVASGEIPEDLYPIVAAFKMTFAQRSAIAKALEPFRRRDREGRFAKEFGPVKGWFYNKKTKKFFSAAGRNVGPTSKPNISDVEYSGVDGIPDGIYEQDISKSENIEAILPESAIKDLNRSVQSVSTADQKDAVDLDQFLATRKDAPTGWTRMPAEGGRSRDTWTSPDGKTTATKGSDGKYTVEKLDGSDKEEFSSWGEVQEYYVGTGGSLDAPRGELPEAREEPTWRERSVADGESLRDIDRRDIVPQNAPNEPDLNQDASGPTEDLSPDLLGEGYGFAKDGDNNWVQEEVGPNGESYSVSRAPNGKWVVSESSGSGPDNFKERDIESFDNAADAFEAANGQGVDPNEFDQSWVEELQKDQGTPDLNQNISVSSDTLDRGMLSPEMAEKYAKDLDDMDKAIANDDFRAINSLLERAALDLNLPDDVYDALYSAREVRATRGQIVENALAGGSKEELESLLDDPKYSGWSDRLQDALAQDIDLDQDAPILSEKQSEAASGKQYAFLDEFLAERQLDPATEQAFRDAIENKNLNKAQASALIGIGRAADFKADVDPNKPSERMLNSLQGYLASKDLTPSEIKETLDSLQRDGSRDNVDALLNKLRRKKDKPVDLNQGASAFIRHSDGSYEWEDIYNNINVNKGPNGWEVEYTSPDLGDRGGQTWSSRRFNSEDEALAFAEQLLRENQDDSGFARAANLLTATPDLDQDAKGTLADPATDKQFDFLQSLLDGKKITDPNLEQAVRSAIEERNLTKGEAGAFIGQLRAMEDKPNTRRAPSAKQIASIQRAAIERDLTPEERKDLEDRLAAGMSFDEASEALNDLKRRPITPQGMSNLLDNMLNNQDLDGLKYLLTKPEYSEYNTDIRDTIQTLRRDQGTDQDFDPDLDVDLNQDAGSVDPARTAKLGGVRFPNKTAQVLEGILEEKIDRLSAEGASPEELRNLRMLQAQMRNIRLRDRKWGEVSPPDFIDLTPDEAQQALLALDEFLAKNPDSELSGLGGRSLQKTGESFEDYNKRNKDIKENALPDLREKLESLASGVLPTPKKRPPTDKQIASIRRGALERGLSEEEAAAILDRVDDLSFDDASKIISDLKARPITDEGIDNLVNNSELDVLESIVDRPDYAPWKDKIQAKIDELRASPDLDQDVDLNQDASSSVSRDDLANKLAEDVDAEDIFLVSGNEIKSAIEFFDTAKFTFSAGEMVKEIYEVATVLDDRNMPELAKRARELADLMFDELVDRFGFGDAGRYENGFDPVDLDDAQNAIRDERAMFFETDVDEIIDALNRNDSYGDSKSGGAEVFVNQEEDGTWTASVDYDRGDDQFTGDDRDEVVRQAAEAAADYNRDVIPSSYQEDADLREEASEAKTPEQAAAFADKLDAIADDLEGNRGDPQLAGDLRESARAIRDAIARKDEQNQAEAPNEPITPETMEEMATDPDLNPAGYAESVSDDLYKQFEANQEINEVIGRGEERPEVGTYTSADGRVSVEIDVDVDGMTYTVKIDGNQVEFDKFNFSDELASTVGELVEEYFSKKA